MLNQDIGHWIISAYNSKKGDYMILYLYGNNSYAINNQLGLILQKYLSKNQGEGDFVRYDMTEVKPNSLISDLAIVPMFSTSRLVFAENIGKAKLTPEDVKKIISITPESTNLVLIDTSPDKRTTIFKELSKLPGAKEFVQLSDDALVRWVVAESVKGKSKIESSTARYLIDYVGKDQWTLHNEITKLASYNANITRESIDKLASPSIDSTTFSMAEALVKKDYKKALKIYDELKLYGNSDQLIQGSIIYQYRTILLAILNDPELTRSYKVSPYPLQKARSLAGKMSIDDIQKAYKLIAKADLATKTGELPAEEAMREMIYQLCN